MSRFTGPQESKAVRALRIFKRAQAEARNARTPPERRRAHREADPASRKAVRR